MIFCNTNLSIFKNDLAKYEGTNFAFAGIITDVQHRVSKAGKGWGSFVVEDYHDSFEFRLFGEDYLKFRHFLIPNQFLYLKTTIQPGWTNKEGVKGEPRIKFTDCKLLHDVMDNLCKKITIKMHLEDVNEDAINNLEDLLKTNPGKQQLNFTIIDIHEKVEIKLPSRNTKVKISQEFLTTLEKQKINFKLN